MKKPPKIQQAPIERVAPMLKKLVRRHFVLGGGVLSREALWDVAEEAVLKALPRHDPSRSKWSTYAHSHADWAMLDALAIALGRANSPAVRALRGVCEHAQQMQERGSLMHDSDEQTAAHLGDAMDELAAMFGAGLSPSPEDVYAFHETKREVHAAIAELSAHEAAIVRLRAIEGRTLEATGEALQVSTAQIHRDEPGALQRLQAVLRRRGLGGAGPEAPAASPPPI